MSSDDRKAVLEIVKGILYTGVGVGIGITISMDSLGIYKWIIAIGLVVLLILIAMVINLFFAQPDHSKQLTRTSLSDSSAKVSSRQNIRQDSGNAAGMQNDARMNSMANGQISRTGQLNALDRMPMSAEKKEMHEKNRRPATRLVLLNEEGASLLSWSLQNTTCLIIGKSTDKEPVDVDLSGSAVAQMISKQHAVLNYTERGWFIDDIDSKNGTRVKKTTQNSIMDVKLVGAIEVEPGDIIYIANAMLQIQ